MNKPDTLQQEIATLDQQLDQVLQLVRHLQEENRALRASQEHLSSEQANMMARNEHVRDKLSGMIQRLKELEHHG